MLAQTYAFPKDWSQPPRLFSLTEWQNRVQADGGQLNWWVPAASWDEHWEPLPQDNVILLTRAPDGTLSRATGSVDVHGGTLALKPPEAPQSWPPAQLGAPLLER